MLSDECLADVVAHVVWWLKMVYDICIVGAGLWGSAAARHATKPGRKVCLVGPSEPRQEERHSRDIFSSHYDAGRTFRQYQGTNHIRSLISMRTFKSLQELENITGTKLFSEVGHLGIGKNANKELTPFAKNAAIFLTPSEVRDRYPFLDISQYASNAFLFPHNAGYVNPRLVVTTQQKVARQQGCDIIDDVVESVTETRNRMDEETMMQVKTKSGATLLAKRVLLCTGAFTNFKALLPRPLKLDMRIMGTFIVKLEVGETDLKTLSTMPCGSLYTEPEKASYFLPPIKYPDGKSYVKIGPLGIHYGVPLRTLQEVKHWFISHTPDETSVETFKDICLDIVKDFCPLSIKSEPCVETKTPTTLPYCDMVSPRLGLAIGGNGFGAMMSDEMGRMAAEMIAGTEKWNLDIPRDALKVRFIPYQANL